MSDEHPDVNGDSITIRELLGRITDDVRTIARDEVELLRDEVKRVVKTVAIEAAVAMFGGVVALIGFAMLCVAAVVALAPLVPSLALRLVIMAAVYGGFGGALAIGFGLRLRRDAVPDVAIPLHEAVSTVKGVKATLQEQGRHAHA